jgi:general secretion pathway protein A
VVVVLDEAQNLSPGILEHIRLLSNLETDQRKLMQILLVGQPELDRRLARPELRQFRQRVMIRCALCPLDEAETAAYLEHRLRVAGAPPEVRFDASASHVVYRCARGIPRLVNKVSDRALLAAYAGGRRVVSREDARRAASEMESLL